MARTIARYVCHVLDRPALRSPCALCRDNLRVVCSFAPVDVVAVRRAQIELWTKIRKHARSLQTDLGIKLDESLDASAFAGAAMSSGGLAMLSDVPRMLRHCTELAGSFEQRSEQAPENEIYDNFTRSLKAEVIAHFMQMCDMAGADGYLEEQDDEEFLEDYTPLDDDDDDDDDSEEREEGEVGGDNEADAEDYEEDTPLDDDSESAGEEGEEEPAAAETDDAGGPGRADYSDNEDEDEDEDEDSGLDSMLPSQANSMTAKEMRLELIDQIYSEPQLRMLAEGCAMVDGIPPAGYVTLHTAHCTLHTVHDHSADGDSVLTTAFVQRECFHLNSFAGARSL